MEPTIGEILLDKLSAHDIALLVDAHEDGTLDDVFWHELYPEDKKNRPELYVDPEDV